MDRAPLQRPQATSDHCWPWRATSRCCCAARAPARRCWNLGRLQTTAATPDRGALLVDLMLGTSYDAPLLDALALVEHQPSRAARGANGISPYHLNAAQARRCTARRDTTPRCWPWPRVLGIAALARGDAWPPGPRWRLR